MSLVGNVSMGGDPGTADEEGAECETAFTLILHSGLVTNLIREDEAGRERVSPPPPPPQKEFCKKPRRSPKLLLLLTLGNGRIASIFLILRFGNGYGFSSRSHPARRLQPHPWGGKTEILPCLL